MKRKLILIVGVLIIAMSLLAVGCGGQDAANQENENQGTEETAGEQEQVLKFAMSGAYKPFNYYNENNELTGFDVEIGKALAEQMGVKPEPIATPWQGIIAGLKAERYDAIIGSMTITEEREEQVDFAGPYYVSGAQLFVAPDSNIKGIKDINDDVTVGVTISTVYEEKARDYTSSVKTYDSDVTALRDLAQGRTDAVITDRFVGMLAAEDSGLEVKPVGDLLFVENIGIAVREGEDELKEQLNQALKEIQKDGTYLQISEKYFDTDISK
ncbi:MAG: transporter substrate-binding domain-containing protein [Firmicutes bacterium]|nr:transporter substrate-binding domain-containing protein [Bacillota bacterium]